MHDFFFRNLLLLLAEALMHRKKIAEKKAKTLFYVFFMRMSDSYILWRANVPSNKKLCMSDCIHTIGAPQLHHKDPIEWIKYA